MSRGVMGEMVWDGHRIERFTEDDGKTWQAECSCGWESLIVSEDAEITAAMLYTHVRTHGWPKGEA